MRRALLGAALALAPAARAAAPGRGADGILQIGIVRQGASVTVRPEGDFSIIDQTTGETQRLRRGEPYEVSADKGRRLSVGPFLFLGSSRLLPRTPKDFVLIGEKKYRGNLVLKPNANGTVTVVAEMGIEEYLYGVLPKEMSPDWPLEALKAQAVVARTFALANLGKFKGEGFDLSDDSRSQLYSGLEVDSPRVRQAVAETAGQVLYWEGALLPVFYHSCCGGATADPSLIWRMGGPTPKPLRGVNDRWCKASPYFQWSAYFSAADILSVLQRHGSNGVALKAARAGKRTFSGYLQEIRFELDLGPVVVRANDFRNWMGSAELKSTQIWRVLARKKGYEFVGRGYGHGVGMCQWGALAQARSGRDYRKILRYYFPGAELVTRET